METASGHEPYTLHRDSSVEDHIHNIIMSITSELVRSIRPVAVVLTGSGSRGEMTAYRQNGKIKIVSDVEIAVVDSSLFKRHKIRKMRLELAKKHRIDLTLMFFLPKRFIDCAPANWASRNSPLSIEQYEIVQCGRFLYGPDLRGCQMNADADSIPIWEGIRLMFNRMAELSDAVLTPTNNADSVLKACNKLLISSGDAWLLKTGQYHYSYKERLRRLEESYTFSSSLYKVLSGTDYAAVTKAYRLKLYPQVSTNLFEEGWISQSLSVSQRVFETIVRDELSLKFSSCRDFYVQYLNHDKIKNYCRTKPFLANIITLLRTHGQYVPISLKHLFKSISISHKIYADIYFWLYGWFRPHWDAMGYDCFRKNRSMKNRGRKHVRYWKLLCE